MDFKSLRSDKLKLTQEEFANLYGISIQEVQELDKTGKPDMQILRMTSSTTFMCTIIDLVQ